MPHPQLTEYIRKAKEAGQAKEEITSALLGAGWKQEDVDEGFAMLPNTFAHPSTVGGKSKTLIIALSVFLFLLLAGGGFAYWYFVYEQKAETPQVVQEQAQQAKEETIEDILAKAENIGPVQYESKTTDSSSYGDTEITTAKVWQKLPYIKLEISDPTGRFVSDFHPIFILSPEGTYFSGLYGDKHLFIPAGTSTEDVTLEDFFNVFGKGITVIDLKKQTLNIVGKEIIDGKQTTVVEYSTNKNGMVKMTKVWVANNWGLPLKSEVVLKIDDSVLTTATENENFVFGDIPDSVFEVPAEKIIESPFFSQPIQYQVKEIRIVPIGVVPSSELEALQSVLREEFSAMDIVITERIEIPAEALDEKKQQMNAETLLDELRKVSSEPAIRLLGVTNVDMFTPRLNFVFSSTESKINSAVMSIARLASDENKKRDRYRKIVLRTLGITFGFRSSFDRSCVMAFSNSLEELDAKGTKWCGDEPGLILEIQGLSEQISQVEAESRARDIKRKIDLQMLTIAITLYTSEQKPKVAPLETDYGCPEGWAVDMVTGTIGCPDFAAGNPPFSRYVPLLPKDSMANTYVYSNQGGNESFCLGARMENDWAGDPGTDDFMFICNSTGCRDVPGTPSNPWTVASCPER